MDRAIPSDHAWLFSNPRAELHAGALCGLLDVSRPELGLSRLTIDRQPCSGKLFGVLPHAQSEWEQTAPHDELSKLPVRQLADAYVRGDDLVAAYKPTEAWPYDTQIYWQATDPASATELLSSMSLLVSLQTHLLDTWPTMCIETRLMADEVQHLERSATNACCILYRLAEVPITYAEIMPTSDMRRVTIGRGNDGAYHARWELFAEFLEKGVIRRARMHSIVVPRARDTEIASAACDAMDCRPLPLTT
jgi:hypothetical protein